MPRLTYVATIAASEDCRFVCSACYSNCWGVHRLRGETAWLCPRCADMKDNGLVPGPRPFHTQLPRQLGVREQLRSPEGVWTVTSSERVKTREDGTLQHACMYVLTREDGHEEEWRGRDMADFHLIPADFEHMRPWRPEDFDDRCETCGAPAGQLCRAWCDTGYTADDARRDAEIRPISRSKE
jgi:hypothetical protein